MVDISGPLLVDIMLPETPEVQITPLTFPSPFPSFLQSNMRSRFHSDSGAQLPAQQQQLPWDGPPQPLPTPNASIPHMTHSPSAPSMSGPDAHAIDLHDGGGRSSSERYADGGDGSRDDREDEEALVATMAAMSATMQDDLATSPRSTTTTAHPGREVTATTVLAADARDDTTMHRSISMLTGSVTGEIEKDLEIQVCVCVGGGGGTCKSALPRVCMHDDDLAAPGALVLPSITAWIPPPCPLHFRHTMTLRLLKH